MCSTQWSTTDDCCTQNGPIYLGGRRGGGGNGGRERGRGFLQNDRIKMASLLALNDDCLHRIVSCLDDPGSFYNISLTCKRLSQVTKSARNVMHSKLLLLETEYNIKSYLAEFY